MIPTSMRVAVLGSGIMGSSLALFLARRGFHVSLFDRESRPFDRASRWNEGKIHLGYLYGADPSLRTARKLIPGGLAFPRLLSELLGQDLADHVTQEDDIFLIHRDSIVQPEAILARMTAVSDLLRKTPEAKDYFVDVSSARVKSLSEEVICELANPDRIVAGFAVPERSIDTQWVADRFVEALAAEDRINLRLGTKVIHSRPSKNIEGKWVVGLSGCEDEEFDIVINALWNGRMAVDQTAGLILEPEWSNRYRLALFVQTSRPVAAKSSVISLGPFGDIKVYDEHNFYLSWYPAGLILESDDIEPPDPRPVGPVEKQKVISAVQQGLGEILPSAIEIMENARSIVCEGGFVFAQGTGSIGEISSSLHERYRYGLKRYGAYISVDTGKYSTAPEMAFHIAREISGG